MQMLLQFVMFLVRRLHLSVEELVFAYACVERVLNRHTTVMRTYSVRPMLLGACVIACKVTRDHAIKVCQCFNQVSCVLDELQLEALVRIEHQMLELLGWCLPMGLVLQRYADALLGVASEARGIAFNVPQMLDAWEAPRARALSYDTMAGVVLEMLREQRTKMMIDHRFVTDELDMKHMCKVAQMTAEIECLRRRLEAAEAQVTKLEMEARQDRHPISESGKRNTLLEGRLEKAETHNSSTK